MSSAELKRKLLGDRVSKSIEDVEVDGVGTIRIRPLSRREMAEVSELEGFEQEAHILSLAVVDPVLTVDEVREWQACSPAGEINRVAMAVNRLSKITPGADKEQYKSV